LADYIVQGHRFDIFEDVGCQAAVYISIEAILIIWFPQLLFFTISFIFGALALHNFVRRRQTFAFHLHESNSDMTTNQYLRLIAMALTEMSLGTSLTAFNLFSNVFAGLRPWISWENVHSNFSRVGLFPTSILPPQLITNMMILWWTLPASSIIFFAFFGFGEEALKEYKKVWVWIKVKVFKRPVSDEMGKSSIGGSSFRNRFVYFLYMEYLTDISLLAMHLESCSF
jgi:pheromone a factor receptor